MANVIRNVMVGTAIASGVGFSVSGGRAIANINNESNKPQTECVQENKQTDKNNNTTTTAGEKIADFVDDMTAPNTTIPWASTLAVSLAGLGLNLNDDKNKQKINIQNNEENNKPEDIKGENFPQEFSDEETELANGRNGKMPNRSISKQSKFMQYAIENLKNIGDEVKIGIQNGKGSVKIKKVDKFETGECKKGARLAKVIEKANGENVIYDIHLLEYPQYDRKEIYYNRMFEYKNGSDIMSPDAQYNLYEKSNGYTDIDSCIHYGNGNTKDFLKRV